MFLSLAIPFGIYISNSDSWAKRKNFMILWFTKTKGQERKNIQSKPQKQVRYGLNQAERESQRLELSRPGGVF